MKIVGYRKQQKDDRILTHSQVMSYDSACMLKSLGPELTTDVAFPLPAGSQVIFTCNVESTKQSTNFIWDCLNNKAVTTSVLKGDKIKSTSIMIAVLYDHHDGKTCICTANVDGYNASTSIRIKIDKKPDLYLEELVSCNNSSLATLSCFISTEMPIYGFTSWTHAYQGTLIRLLNGKMQGNHSILTIDSCSYEDTGDYTCIAWNEYNGNSVYANKTVTLFVYSAPVVISTSILENQNGSSLFIRFYSYLDTTAIWVYQNIEIRKSSQSIQMLNRRTVQVQFYNKSIDCDGYIASIIFPSSITGHYIVHLRNEFGEAQHTFQVQITKSKDLVASFDFRFLVFGISGFGIFIATTAGAAIMFKGRRYHNVIHIVSPLETSTIPIYHCAPSTEPVVHIYDTVNSGYLEVVNNDYLYQQSEASGANDKESDEISTTSANTVPCYEEID
ncbi:unnamed protein product [Mytilus coruscus]|uniref:Ig-like domain-containing protein n=1 Tax=Mytilus coruscus TaxID=42192 RepID=A0A6J8BT88_MYTCO|nr:unnamed protein product [Mytilus coruscus]